MSCVSFGSEPQAKVKPGCVDSDLSLTLEYNRRTYIMKMSYVMS